MTTSIPSESSWPMIRAAAAGGQHARREFTQRYLGVIRAYLNARWQGPAFESDGDDAVQEVFVELFREEGVLDRLGADAPRDFRVYLLGVVRNVARRFEARRRLPQHASSFRIDAVCVDETTLSRVFDRAWARSVMREAAKHQRELARDRGEAALQRVELLHLRFHDGLPIREIARLWQAPPARLHHEFARAREEFAQSLRHVVGLHRSCGAAELHAEVERLLSSLAR